MDGEMPEGWRKSLLGRELAAIAGGGTPARNVPEYWNGSIPWASVKDIKSPRLRSTGETITDAGLRNSATRTVPPGTLILVTRMNVGALTVTELQVAINQDLKALIPCPWIDPRFLFHFLARRASRLAAGAAGTTVAGIRLEQLQSLPISVPPTEEQVGIARVLDAIDEAIEKTEAVIAATEDLRKALLQELLTRGVPGWHTEWKTVPGIGTIPACWEVVRLDDIAEVQTGRQVGKLTSKGEKVAVPYLSVANVKDGYLRLDGIKTMVVGAGEIDRFLLRRGDVLFTEGGDADKLGRGCVWSGEVEPCLHQNHVFAVRPNLDRFSSWFLSSSASSPRGKAYFLSCAKQTTNLASINSTQLKAMPLPLPKPCEQGEIQSVVEAIETCRRSEEGHLAALRNMKTVAADALLSGRVRIPSTLEARA